MNKKSLFFSLILVVFIVVLVNVLSARYYYRFDLTDDHRFTLSDLTKQTLAGLTEPITITAYFSEDLPPDIAPVKSDLQVVLTEYQSYSRNNVEFDFIDPSGNPDWKVKAEKLGVTPIPAQTRERDKIVLKELYLSVLVQMGDRHVIIPVLQPGASIEYALSGAIVKLTTIERPRIGYILGHGEAPLSSIPQALAELDIQYDVVPVSLDSFSGGDYKALVMLAPKDSIPMEHYKQLDRYLAEGGNLFLGFRRVEANFATAQGYEVNWMLGRWLAERGIILRGFFVLDQHCGFINVQQAQGVGEQNIQTKVDFPYFPIITNFADHPITRGLESVVLSLASPIQYIGDSTLHFTPLLWTSSKSGVQKSPLKFSAKRKWTDQDFPSKSIVLAAAFEGPMGGAKPARMVVVTNGDFPVNGEGDQAQELIPDNIYLLTNSVDWLLGKTGLSALRSSGVTDRWLSFQTDRTRSFLKAFNFLLPILLMLVYGVFRYGRSRAKRRKMIL